MDQTYKQAMHNLSVANMLRTENKITLLMCKPEGYKGVISAMELYDEHYEARVGDIDCNDPFEIMKRDIAHKLLKLMIRDFDIPYTSINYYNFVMEVERAFWNSENWKKSPIEFLHELYEAEQEEESFNTIEDYFMYFMRKKESKAIKYILDTVKRI